MKRSLISLALYIIPLLSPIVAHADLFFAVRTYCTPEAHRFQLEPFPINLTHEGKIPARTLKDLRKQAILAALQSQYDGELKTTCKLGKNTYNAIVTYQTTDTYNHYLQGRCSRVDTYAASIKLFRNGHHIMDSSFGRECEDANTTQVIVGEKDTGEYGITVCLQSPSWRNPDLATIQCNNILRQPTTNEPLSEQEQKELFSTKEYELTPISPTSI